VASTTAAEGILHPRPGKAAPAKAVLTATRYVSGRYGLVGIKGISSRRSKRKPDWGLVTGFYRRPGDGGRWAVWLQLVDGYWIVKHAGLDEKAAAPPKSLRVPCDIRPAFSEPAC
jgi:hypothetical protein